MTGTRVGRLLITMCGAEAAAREYEMMLRSTDPISLHLEASLGYAQYVPNLVTGSIETISLIEFAHLIDPPVRCPECRAGSDDGTENNASPSLVILSSSGQCSYLCECCWKHSQIPFFGIYSRVLDDT